MNDNGSTANFDRLILWILWNQKKTVAAFHEALECCFALDGYSNDISSAGNLL